MSGEDIAETLRTLAQRARAASRELARANRAAKDAALMAVARRLRETAPALLAANRADVTAYREGKEASAAMADRLTLTEARLGALAKSVEEVARQDDPVGAVTGMVRRPNGLLVGQVRIPLGVIGIIYESRPNVTVDAAVLCLKSGNSVLLRGGSEASHSNAVLGALLRDAIAEAGLPRDAVQMVPPGNREAMRVMLGLTGLIDLVIPRGGEGLVRFVSEHARVPVIQHYMGVCHMFIDEGADHAKALGLVVDGKTVRPGVCNALECLLVHQAEAARFLPKVRAMAEEKGVELRGCERTLAILPDVRPAEPSDFGHEFLDKIMAVRVVDGIEDALSHVAKYGSGHTEAICTASYERSERWLREVDASCVLVNASTRFNDGGELGLGAEIGISTSKLHAFGPMGIESLTTKKWIVYGEGQVRG